MIMCQCHGSEFDVTTGAVVRAAAIALVRLGARQAGLSKTVTASRIQ
jgi:nitrite reductase/ring-hydroxylating ferredoxin subunit